MRFGVGCCCCDCTYLMRDWVSGTPFTFTNFVSGEHTRTLIEDDGSPIRCNDRIKTNKPPCIEWDFTVEYSTENGEETGWASIYEAGEFLDFFWQPDGETWHLQYRVDLQLRRQLTLLTDDTVWDGRDKELGDPLANSDMNLRLLAKQGDSVYVYSGANYQFRGNADAPTGTPYVGDWCHFGGLGGNIWNSFYRINRNDASLYGYDALTHPDVSDGAAPIQFGYCIRNYASQNPIFMGEQLIASQQLTQRIDNLCIKLYQPG